MHHGVNASECRRHAFGQAPPSCLRVDLQAVHGRYQNTSANANLLYQGIDPTPPPGFTFRSDNAPQTLPLRRRESHIGRMVKKELDIAEDTDPVSNPRIHDVIVLEPGRVIPTIYSGYWFSGRPTPRDARTQSRGAARPHGAPASRASGRAKTSYLQVARSTAVTHARNSRQDTRCAWGAVPSSTGDGVWRLSSPGAPPNRLPSFAPHFHGVPSR